MLDKEGMKGEVLSTALSKGDMEDSAASRVICIRILGALACYMVRVRRSVLCVAVGSRGQSLQ